MLINVSVIRITSFLYGTACLGFISMLYQIFRKPLISEGIKEEEGKKS